MGVYMDRTNFLLGIFLLAFSQEIALAIVNVKSFACDFDKQHFSNGYCNLTKSRHRTTYLNAGCTFREGMDKLSLQISLLRSVKNKYEVFGPGLNHNVCDIGKASTLDYFTKRIFTMVFKSLQGVTCPMTGSFSINKYAFMLPMPKALMPASDYVINTLLKREGQTLMVANVSFTVTT